MGEFDYSNRSTTVLVAEIKMLETYAASETNESLRTHYKLQLESANAEMSKRNEAEIARRTAEKLS